MPTGLKVILLVAVILIGIVLLFSLAFIRRPIRRLITGGVQGLCAMAAVNLLGGITGVSLGVNIYSGLICLFLGVPGVVALLLSNLLFQV